MDIAFYISVLGLSGVQCGSFALPKNKQMLTSSRIKCWENILNSVCIGSGQSRLNSMRPIFHQSKIISQEHERPFRRPSARNLSDDLSAESSICSLNVQERLSNQTNY